MVCFHWANFFPVVILQMPSWILCSHFSSLMMTRFSLFNKKEHKILEVHQILIFFSEL